MIDILNTYVPGFCITIIPEPVLVVAFVYTIGGAEPYSANTVSCMAVFVGFVVTAADATAWK